MNSIKSLKLFVVLILFVLSFYIFTKFNDEKIINTSESVKIYETTCGKYEKRELEIVGQKLFVDIADDECKMTLGLSGKESLVEEGMLFIFENVGNYTFWMKDMNFSIDILWIDDTYKIIGIEKDLSPDTYPQSFGDSYFAKYILEVPAKYSDKNDIKIGDKIMFTTK